MFFRARYADMLWVFKAYLCNIRMDTLRWGLFKFFTLKSLFSSKY